MSHTRFVSIASRNAVRANGRRRRRRRREKVRRRVAAAEGQFTFLPPVLRFFLLSFLSPPSFLVLPSAADSICRLLTTLTPPQ